MSSIIEVSKSVTPSQKLLALEMTEVLMSHGFKPDHLDDLVLRIAASYGESCEGDPKLMDERIDAELAAADELNMYSMERQLEFLAAHYVTREALLNAIEMALSVDLNSDN